MVARTSAFQFSGKGYDLREVGEQLRVGTVLEGSVRRSGDRLRINAQLINAEDGYHLWSERYDREMNDIFAVQEEMASAIVEELKVQLLAEGTAPIVRQPTDNVEAYHLYLKGRHCLNKRTEETLTKGISLFEEAIARDARYAAAYAGLADGLMLLGPAGYGAAHVDALARARVAALKALEFDDQLAEAHEALGFLHFRFDWQWVDAEKELRRAIQLNAVLRPPTTAWRCARLRRDELTRRLRPSHELLNLIPSRWSTTRRRGGSFRLPDDTTRPSFSSGRHWSWTRISRKPISTWAWRMPRGVASTRR